MIKVRQCPSYDKLIKHYTLVDYVKKIKNNIQWL